MDAQQRQRIEPGPPVIIIHGRLTRRTCRGTESGLPFSASPCFSTGRPANGSWPLRTSPCGQSLWAHCGSLSTPIIPWKLKPVSGLSFPCLAPLRTLGAFSLFCAFLSKLWPVHSSNHKSGHLLHYSPPLSPSLSPSLFSFSPSLVDSCLVSSFFLLFQFPSLPPPPSITPPVRFTLITLRRPTTNVRCPYSIGHCYACETRQLPPLISHRAATLRSLHHLDGRDPPTCVSCFVDTPRLALLDSGLPVPRSALLDEFLVLSFRTRTLFLRN